MSLLSGVEEVRQPTLNRAHKSPVVVEDGGVVTVSVLPGGVEAVSLLTGVEEERRQPRSPRIHKSPLVLGGVSVDEGGWLD